MRFIPLTLAAVLTNCLWAQLNMSDSGMRNIPGISDHSAASQLIGRIEANGASDLHQLRIQLVSIGSHHVVAETNPIHDGSFEIASPGGMHELRVVTLYGEVIHSQAITLPFHNTVVINLKQGARLSPSYTPVSLSRLQHKVPRKALKEFIAASRASSKGKTNEAILHLEKAIEIDGDYFEALNNLGVLFIRNGLLDSAREKFERATKIDPADSIAETNLAFTLLGLGRYVEAEQAARAGLRGDAFSSRARFYLAVSLLEQNKPKSEALFHLSKASPQLEPARKLLEHLQNEAKLPR